MKRPSFYAYLLPVAVCLLVGLRQAYGSVSSVADARKQLAASIAGADADWKKEAAANDAKYIENLDSLDKTMTGKGDLDGVMAAREEKKRFVQSKDVPDTAVADRCEPLKSLQLKYQRSVLVSSATRSDKIVSLFKKHRDALVELEKELTKKGDIDGAVQARQEREKAASDATATKAEFELAEAKAKLAELDARLGIGPVAKPAEFAKPPEPARPSPESLPRWPSVGGNGAVIHEKGLAPQSLSGPKFSRLAGLTPTANGRNIQRVTVGVQRGVQENYSGKDPASPYSSGYYGGSSVYHREKDFLRMVFNCRSVDDAVAKPLLYVEYYSRSVGQQAEPRRCRAEQIKLPNIVGTEKVSLDTAGFVVGWYDSRYSKYGEKYYGVRISLFDADGKLVYQVASESTLASDAPAGLPGAESYGSDD